MVSTKVIRGHGWVGFFPFKSDQGFGWKFPVLFCIIRVSCIWLVLDSSQERLYVDQLHHKVSWSDTCYDS